MCHPKTSLQPCRDEENSVFDQPDLGVAKDISWEAVVELRVDPENKHRDFKKLSLQLTSLHLLEILVLYLQCWIISLPARFASQTYPKWFRKLYLMSEREQDKSDENLLLFIFSYIYLTFAISVMVFALSINFRWSILTFRNLRHIFEIEINFLENIKGILRVNGQQELSLMSSNSSRIYSLHQPCVFINQPRLTKHVCCCILQLIMTRD